MSSDHQHAAPGYPNASPGYQNGKLFNTLGNLRVGGMRRQPGKFWFVMLCCASFFFALLCFALLCVDRLCFAWLCFALLCFDLHCFVFPRFTLSSPEEIFVQALHCFGEPGRGGQGRGTRGESPRKPAEDGSSRNRAGLKT